METKPTDLKIGDTPTVMALFKNTMGNCVYIFKNGKPAIFQQGRYLTNSEGEIQELMAEVQAGNPHIYVDQAEFVVDTKFVDPLESIRAKIIAELHAQGRLIDSGETDFGTSEAGKLTVGTTTSVAAAMSGSNSGAGTASVTGAAAPAGSAKIALKAS
jgi:hypothetical protein